MGMNARHGCAVPLSRSKIVLTGLFSGTHICESESMHSGIPIASGWSSTCRQDHIKAFLLFD